MSIGCPFGPRYSRLCKVQFTTLECWDTSRRRMLRCRRQTEVRGYLTVALIIFSPAGLAESLPCSCEYLPTGKSDST